MRRTTALAPVLVAVLALAACAADDSSSPTSAAQDSPTPVASPTVEATDTAAVSPFEGTWTTDLTPDAARAYIRKNGWSKRVERAIMRPDMAAPPTTEFRLDFEDGYFRMALAATDEQWQSGSYRLEDGRIYLDDEAPVGESTFHYDLNGDTVTFDDPADTSDPDNKTGFLDGAPIWAVGGVIWGSTTWKRADGS